METTVRRIAGELGVGEEQIEAVLRLLGEGATVPFLARYRKEATGGLDLARLRAIEDRLQQVRELDERRGFILKAVAEQGRLTPELQTAVAMADSRARLEDLYLPFKQKRRSRANQARDSGSSRWPTCCCRTRTCRPRKRPTASSTPRRASPTASPLSTARAGFCSSASPTTRGCSSRCGSTSTRTRCSRPRWSEGRQEKGAKFAEYFAFSEPARAVPSHRVLALFRGRKEGVLRLALVLPVRRPARPRRRRRRRRAARAGAAAEAGEDAAPPSRPRRPPPWPRCARPRAFPSR